MYIIYAHMHSHKRGWTRQRVLLSVHTSNVQIYNVRSFAVFFFEKNNIHFMLVSSSSRPRSKYAIFSMVEQQRRLLLPLIVSVVAIVAECNRISCQRWRRIVHARKGKERNDGQYVNFLSTFWGKNSATSVFNSVQSSSSPSFIPLRLLRTIRILRSIWCTWEQWEKG